MADFWPGRNFARSEFRCRCGCGADHVDAELISALDVLREHLDSPIILTSGTRCPWHNANVGGAKSSFHLFGKAADIVAPTYTPRQVYETIDRLFADQYGAALYPRWVHFDVRPHHWRDPQRG